MPGDASSSRSQAVAVMDSVAVGGGTIQNHGGWNGDALFNDRDGTDTDESSSSRSSSGERTSCRASCLSICGRVVSPAGLALGKAFVCLPRFGYSTRLPDEGPLGSREDTLHHLGKIARLVYGRGWINKEYFALFDPPLNGEGWVVVGQVVQTAKSGMSVQAGCYVREDGPDDVVVVAYRGVASRRGAFQALDSRFLNGPLMQAAVKQAVAFCTACQDNHPYKTLYACGHSLGGFLAECVASRCSVAGAAFNNPGPWHSTWRNITGPARPCFEIHLTRQDPVNVLFPKPQNSAHIGTPIWHDGRSHRICLPYMCEIEEMEGVCENELPIDKTKTVKDDQESHTEGESESDGQVEVMFT